MNLCIFEDPLVRGAFPITYMRPVFEMRCGMLTLRQKIEHRFSGDQIIYYVRDYLKDVLAEQYPDALINQLPQEDTLFVNGRLLFNEFYEFAEHGDQSIRYRKNDTVVVAFLPGRDIGRVQEQGEHHFLSFASVDFNETHEVDCRLFRYPWEFVKANASEIEADIPRRNLTRTVDPEKFDHSHILNPDQVYLGENVVIKPSGVLDATTGPIIIDDNVEIGHNSTILGPCYIGANSKISAVANIKGKVSMGPVCKVGGEVGETIIQGYSNKKHEGFLGGAYVGKWVNLGASTNNSDLKNNYAPVSVPVNGELIDTGMQFYGCILGDHTKTAIGTKINTGSSYGIGCNIFGAGFPPKFIPSFSWGESEKLVEYHLESMLETAAIVMGRRDIPMTRAYKSLLKQIFTLTDKERENYLQTQSM